MGVGSPGRTQRQSTHSRTWSVLPADLFPCACSRSQVLNTSTDEMEPITTRAHCVSYSNSGAAMDGPGSSCTTFSPGLLDLAAPPDQGMTGYGSPQFSPRYNVHLPQSHGFTDKFQAMLYASAETQRLLQTCVPRSRLLVAVRWLVSGIPSCWLGPVRGMAGREVVLPSPRGFEFTARECQR